MKILEGEQNTEKWLDDRKGRIMGSIAADVIPKPPLKGDVEKALKGNGLEFIQTSEGERATTDMLRKLLPLEALIELGRREDRKVGFYQIIADMLSIPDEHDDPMQRGHDLEGEALDALSELIGKKIHRHAGICMRDDEDRIANSPDGLIRIKGVWGAAAEVKCLKSALHIQAIVENKVPADYWSQACQYFVVNDDLKILYFVFYDPRLKSYPLHIIEVHRADVAETVEKLLAYQKDTLIQVDRIANELAF